MKKQYGRIVEKIEKFQESPKGNKDIENLLTYLHREEGLEYKEAFAICEFKLGDIFDEEKFVDIALSLRIEELPLGGYTDNDGSTLIYGSEETC